jgi:hypothetical protein
MYVKPDLTGIPVRIERPIATEAKEMLSVRYSASGTPEAVRINFSSLDIIQTCPRKAYYLLKRKLLSNVESPALTFGTAIHKALEVFYSMSPKERELPTNFTKNAELIPSGVIPTEKHFIYDALIQFCQKAEPLRGLPDSDKRSIANGVWILSHYFKSYINDEYMVYRDDKGPVTERTFTLPLHKVGGVLIELHGTIDVVLENSKTGAILPADHKTSSIVGNDFYSRLRPNHQYTGYLMGAQQVLGLQTDSFLVNCIQVKPKPVTSRGQPPHFPRQVTKRTKEDFEEFCDVLSEAVTNFLQWSATDIWPLGPVNACANYGGCSFLDICAAPKSLRENMLSVKFNSGATNAITQ